MTEIRHLGNREISVSQRKIIRFWWNLVHRCRFGTPWQSHDQIILIFKLADDRHFKHRFWP